MRSEMLASLLNELNSSSADIEASGIISTDGLCRVGIGIDGIG